MNRNAIFYFIPLHVRVQLEVSDESQVVVEKTSMKETQLVHEKERCHKIVEMRLQPIVEPRIQEETIRITPWTWNSVLPWLLCCRGRGSMTTRSPRGPCGEYGRSTGATWGLCYRPSGPCLTKVGAHQTSQTPPQWSHPRFPLVTNPVLRFQGAAEVRSARSGRWVWKSEVVQTVVAKRHLILKVKLSIYQFIYVPTLTKGH